MASFEPTSRLRSVDLPAFGRPMRDTNPHFMSRHDRRTRHASTSPCGDAVFMGGFLGMRASVAHDPDLVDAAALDFQHVDGQAVDLDAFADGRHASEMIEQISSDRLKALAFDLYPQTLADLVDVDLPVEDEPAIALVDNRLGLDVVFITNLADDLFEHVLDRDEPGGAAVLIHHDGDLGLLALKLLQQLGHTFAFRDDGRRAQKRRDRTGLVWRLQRHQVLDEDKPGDIVEALFEDREAGVLLLAEKGPEIADGGIFFNRDDVGPRCHHFPHERVSEVDDALEQSP